MEQLHVTSAPRADRRRHLRVRLEPGSVGDLKLQVQLRSGEPFEAEILDLSLGGAGVRCRSDASRELDFAERVLLLLRAPRWPAPLRVPARLRSHCEIHPMRRYGFEFEAGGGAEGPVRRLLGLLDRRRAARAAPGPGERARAILHDGRGRFVDAQLCDLSSAGVGLFVPSEPGAELDPGGPYEISLCLPSQEERIVAEARLRRREPAPGGTIYGLEFDAGNSQAFARQREQILAFVLQRLGERFGCEAGEGSE